MEACVDCFKCVVNSGISGGGVAGASNLLPRVKNVNSQNPCKR